MMNSKTVLASCMVLLLLLGTGCYTKLIPDDNKTDTAHDSTKTLTKRRSELVQAKRIPETLTLDLGKGVTMKLVLIPVGTFLMGSPNDEKGRANNEDPQHKVTISKPFYMSIHEVTQAQWRAVMGSEPWGGRHFVKPGDNNALNWVSWKDASRFCETSSKKTGKRVALPTEAQWEYACRAGSKMAYGFGDDASKLGDYAWYADNTNKRDQEYPHAVGRKKPNAFGLYDMHGNVWEWCRDHRHKNYRGAPTDGTAWVDKPPTGLRVLRGGAWGYDPKHCRTAHRFAGIPTDRYVHVGFRPVVSVVVAE
ncbi:MAG: formylglycine-generating enzyme family protein [Phycisphaerae bacterium]|jgi:formylglycine-generating enzyme required for sulfatase activity|nr:formylglycine-generating enzyme family protein [Phycisphaerae bacterium]